MVRNETDMTEHPDDIPHALADPERLRIAGALEPPRDAGIALGAANEDEEAVLRTFSRNGRLNEIPTKTSKRRIVLERIAIECDPGVRYDEREVNVIVGAFSNDLAALRRSGGGSSTGKPVSIGGPEGASTCRRVRRGRVVSGLSRRAGPSHRRFRPFTSEMMHR